MDDFIPFVAILSIFVIFPGMILHYITKWRTGKHLTADNEKMLEDLWHSARRMERRIEALERLVGDDREAHRPPHDPTNHRDIRD